MYKGALLKFVVVFILLSTLGCSEKDLESIRFPGNPSFIGIFKRFSEEEIEVISLKGFREDVDFEGVLDRRLLELNEGTPYLWIEYGKYLLQISDDEYAERMIYKAKEVKGKLYFEISDEVFFVNDILEDHRSSSRSELLHYGGLSSESAVLLKHWENEFKSIAPKKSDLESEALPLATGDLE